MPPLVDKLILKVTTLNLLRTHDLSHVHKRIIDEENIIEITPPRMKRASITKFDTL